MHIPRIDLWSILECVLVWMRYFQELAPRRSVGFSVAVCAAMRVRSPFLAARFGHFWCNGVRKRWHAIRRIVANINLGWPSSVSKQKKTMKLCDRRICISGLKAFVRMRWLLCMRVVWMCSWRAPSGWSPRWFSGLVMANGFCIKCREMRRETEKVREWEMLQKCPSDMRKYSILRIVSPYRLQHNIYNALSTHASDTFKNLSDICRSVSSSSAWPPTLVSELRVHACMRAFRVHNHVHN